MIAVVVGGVGGMIVAALYYAVRLERWSKSSGDKK